MGGGEGGSRQSRLEQDFTIISWIGRGGFGDVIQVRLEQDFTIIQVRLEQDFTIISWIGRGGFGDIIQVLYYPAFYHRAKQCWGSGFNGVPGSRFMRAKMTQKNRRTSINFIFEVLDILFSGLKVSPEAWTFFKKE